MHNIKMYIHVATTSRSPLKVAYKFKDRVINDVHQHHYLGVPLDETMSWLLKTGVCCRRVDNTYI